MSTNLVPLRDISRVMEAAVNYDSDTGKITVTKGTNTMVLTVESKTVYYNGAAEPILVAPLVIDGVTYVPAQVFAKGLNANLNYNKNDNALRVAF